MTVTQYVSRLLFAPTLMVSLATLIKGYSQPGDGFAAGLIAALAFAMQFVAFGAQQVRWQLHSRHAPSIAVIGLAVALTVTFLPVVLGLPLLMHAPPPTAAVIQVGTLEMVTAFVFDIGVFLLVIGFSVTTLTLIARAGEWTRR